MPLQAGQLSYGVGFRSGRGIIGVSAGALSGGGFRGRFPFPFPFTLGAGVGGPVMSFVSVDIVG